MSIDSVSPDKCTGCLSCVNSCPLGCISSNIDSCGFVHPLIDYDNCINCNKCESVCPLLSDVDKAEYEQKVFAAWSKDENNRLFSTSGGIFSELAKYFIRNIGVVCGAAYGNNNEVVHIIIGSENEVGRLAQSKYVQSNTANIYLDVLNHLKGCEKVLFVGTPCQVAAIKKFCNAYLNNLYTIDFICRGVNSPKAYNAWINEIERKFNDKINTIWFKYKDRGWKASPKTTKIIFSSGKELILRDYHNSYMYGYLGPNLYIRPSCADCRFKGSDRVSDITLGDFWGVESNLDNDQGTSLVIVNSKKGDDLFKAIKNYIDATPKNIDDIIQGNNCFSGSVKINTRSKEFLESLTEDISFSKLVDKYLYTNILQKLIVKLKINMKYILGEIKK